MFVGIDIFKSLPSFVIGEKYFTQNTIVVEPSLKIEGTSPQKFLLFSFGFVSGSTNKNIWNLIDYEHFQGFYFKTGFETRNKRVPLSIGFGPIMSVTTFKGNYKFMGPTFGDYQGSFSEATFAIGLHGYLAYDFTTGKNSLIRVSGQISTTLINGDIDPYYYPGLGFSGKIGSILLSTGGLTAQFFYKVR